MFGLKKPYFLPNIATIQLKNYDFAIRTKKKFQKKRTREGNKSFLSIILNIAPLNYSPVQFESFEFSLIHRQEQIN